MKKGMLCFAIVVLMAMITSCQKSTPDTSTLYVPTNTDVTINATLKDLQQGRVLYIDNCSRCHGLYSPDNFTSTQWSGILSQMGPRTGMTSNELSLVAKYVKRGK
jgi:hypothetical protein